MTVHMDTIADIDSLFDELIRKGEHHPDVVDEKIPYWADLWPSAIALAEYLCLQRVVSERTTVLEIGCGLGLPGITAGKFGASVVLTDYMQEPLVFAEHNWYLNNKFSAEFKLLDWRSPDPNLSADVILAADVAYESKAFADLILSFKTLIKPGGVLILAEPNRAFAKTFFDKLRTDGFLLYTDQTFVERHGQKTLVNIHKIYFSH